MAITIRKGREADLPALMELLKEFAVFVKKPNAITTSVKRMKKEKRFFGFFVAEEKGVMVGYSLYFFAYYSFIGKSLYIEDLYIKPQFRGRGIGSSLLRKTIEFAKKESCKSVCWQTRSWNFKAQSFYKKHGGMRNDELLNYYLDEKGIEKFLKGTNS